MLIIFETWAKCLENPHFSGNRESGEILRKSDPFVGITGKRQGFDPFPGPRPKTSRLDNGPKWRPDYPGTPRRLPGAFAVVPGMCPNEPENLDLAFGLAPYIRFCPHFPPISPFFQPKPHILVHFWGWRGKSRGLTRFQAPDPKLSRWLFTEWAP